ncbi:MAG TPA: ATP-binding cassette domain-containing protein [Streptosporangiaceae bacterium]|nr:ATP-binding cassette domain-containing protein [Streptosporangiaceae bacterium]
MTTAVAGLAPDSSEPLLRVSALAVRFGPLRALDGVDLAVRRGELVALAGENGAGKTTLVRCVAGDIRPASGEVVLDGRVMSRDSAAAARQGVAVVWQDLSLCDNLDVASNLLLGQERRWHLLSDVRFHGAAGSLLRDLEIPLSDTTRSVGTLSGGQRQLVAVARAMARKPRLLLLDEPTAALGVSESAQVEELIARLRERGTTILLACHDIDQMFRLADRIVVLRHGRIVADVLPEQVHPDDVAALVAGQQVDSSARRQLNRLHGLADRLVSADPSSSPSLILSALGAALSSDRLCIHLLTGDTLVCAASLGLPDALASAWARLPCGPGGGPAGVAAAAGQPVVDNVRTGAAWAPFSDLGRAAKVASSWSVPVMGPGGVVGIITVFRAVTGKPQRDELDLVTLYAGYASSAIERDRLLDQVTARNRVLETIREVLETLAGPIQVAKGLTVALQALRRGLQADQVALLTRVPGSTPRCRAFVTAAGGAAGVPAPPPALLEAADQLLAVARRDDVASRLQVVGQQFLAVTFAAPAGPTALLAGWRSGPPTADTTAFLAGWRSGPPTADATTLLEDAAHSLRLALEREEAGLAHQEAAALRRSQELQRGFLSRLSHELRTPLTAIRGYASSLMQPDVTWDGDSQQRFLHRIAAESARLGRLVGDLLDFSAIESGILRLQRDWCDIGLVLDAAVACLPPAGAAMIEVACDPSLPVVWADHDRLEQVFVNLLDNAIGHNPPGTRVRVSAARAGQGGIAVSVIDDGVGMPSEIASASFEPMRRRRTPTAGAGLGLAIAKGIVDAHGGRIELEQRGKGTQFRIHLPIEMSATPGGGPTELAAGTVEPGASDDQEADGHGADHHGADGHGAQAAVGQRTGAGGG